MRRADYASNERTCERPYPGACPEVCPAAICDPHLGDVSRGNTHLGVGRLGAHPEGVAVECAKLSCLDSQGTALATLNGLIACDLAPMRDANALPLHGCPWRLCLGDVRPESDQEPHPQGEA